MMKCDIHSFLFIAVVSFLLYVPITATSAPINVSLGFISPLNSSLGPLATLGKELESAFKLAVEAVNDKSPKIVQIRPDFSVSVKDETQDPTTACRNAATYFSSDKKFVGVVGSYSSECALSFQDQLKVLKSQLPQVSYRSPSIQFLNRTKYTGFYRMASNNKREAEAIVDVITHFSWNQASIVHTNDKYYGKELSDEIVTRSRSLGIIIKERVVYDPNEENVKFDKKLEQIKNSGSRVNIVVAKGKDVFDIIKLIQAKGVYGKGWVWILTDGGTSLYFPGDTDVNSTGQGFIGIAPEMFKGPEYLKIVVDWYAKSYPGLILKTQGSPKISPYAGQVYRATELFHSILVQLAKDRKLTSKTEVEDIRKMIHVKLAAINKPANALELMLGDPIYFNEYGDDKPKFTISNYLIKEFKEVGEWLPQQKLTLEPITWPGGVTQTPADKGKPGKTLFQIAFVAPTNSQLGFLSEYGKELISAFKVAVDVINSDAGRYQVELRMLVKDEGVDRVASCTKLAEEIKDKSIVAVVGAFRSDCTIKLHDTLSKKKIPLISYASLSQKLSDVKKYPYLFRVTPSNKVEAQILRQIVNKYSLKEIGILTSTEVSSLEIAKDFKALLVNDTIPIRIYEEFPQNSNASDLRVKVEKVRISGARVILVSALPNNARLLHQIAKEKGMVGKGWMWLGSDGATILNFPDNSEISKKMAGMLGVNPKGGEGSSYLHILSTWAKKDKLKYPGIIHKAGSKSLPYTAQVYDAVNGIALALSNLITRNTISHQTSTQSVREELYKTLKSFNENENGYISALGTKRMYFDENQDGPNQYDVVNLVDGEWIHIGKYETEKNMIQFTKDPIFPGGSTLPFVKAGKVIYKVAAFFPKHRVLGALSDLGKLWESALSATVEWINQNDSLSVGFELTTFDTGLNPENCSSLAKDLPPNTDLIIGAARSACTAVLYQKIDGLDIPMITYASTSTVLARKTMYPNLFRMCPSDSYQAMAIAELVERYNWDKIGIVAANDMYGKELASDVKNLLQTRAIDVTTMQFFKSGASGMTHEVFKLKQTGSAVNLIVAEPHDALQIYQEAFELGMTRIGWTWLGSDGAVSTMFKRAQTLRGAMQGMVGFKPESGRGNLFEKLFKEWLNFDPTADKNTAYVAQVFDSIVLPAITLHNLQREKKITSATSKLDARKALLNRLQSIQDIYTSFASASGRKTYFDSHQDVLPVYDFVNLNGEDWINIGSYENKQLHITQSVVWPGGTVKYPPSNPPREGDTNKNRQEDDSGASKGLVVLAVVFSIFGVLVILFMLYIVRRVRYRHLYMQSDLNQGGFFSVLYGHQNRPGVRLMATTNGHCKADTMMTSSSGLSNDPVVPRHV